MIPSLPKRSLRIVCRAWAFRNRNNSRAFPVYTPACPSNASSFSTTSYMSSSSNSSSASSHSSHSSTSSSLLRASSSVLRAQLDTSHPWNNIPESIKHKAVVEGSRLTRKGHPLARVLDAVRDHFSTPSSSSTTHAPPTRRRSFTCFDNLHPVVTTQQNFDDLLTPLDHVSRSLKDTFYVDDTHVLRCHMTAHQTTLLREGNRAFLMAGDVYRRDTVDATHYPVFHQIDGVRVFEDHELPEEVRCANIYYGSGIGKSVNSNNSLHSDAALIKLKQLRRDFVMADLKGSLEGMTRSLFGHDIELRWIEAYFPFTDPSLELEIFFEGQWLEVLGCGMIRQPILDTCLAVGGSNSNKSVVTSASKNTQQQQQQQQQGTNGEEVVGWAFGMGVERLAMALYGISDIRMFWSEDGRFLDQFKNQPIVPGKVKKFVPYSKQPACFKDVAFWVPAASESGSSSSSSSLSHGNSTTGTTGTTGSAAPTSPLTPPPSPLLPSSVFHENDFFALVREVAGDLCENVTLVDSFTHPKTKQVSKCYRILYRHADRTLTNQEVDEIQEKLRGKIGTELHLKLR